MEINTTIVVSPWLGKVVVVAPSKTHLRALQLLLKDKLDQQDPIPGEEFLNDPESFKDDPRLIFFERVRPSMLFLEADIFTPRDHFFSKETFIIQGTTVETLRDQSGYTWGDKSQQICSKEVLDKYRDIYHSL